MVDTAAKLSAKKNTVVAIGTCATYGGIPAMSGNPTGAMGLPDYLGWSFRSKADIPIVCVPGCPVQPDNFMETLLYLLHQAVGRAPMIPLDEALHLHMDVELCLKMAVLEPKIAYLNQPLGAFRKYEGIKTDSATWREQSLREQAALRERFQRPIWPGAGFDRLRFRLRHHAAVLRRWGVRAIMQRLLNVVERDTKMRVIVK